MPEADKAKFMGAEETLEATPTGLARSDVETLQSLDITDVDVDYDKMLQVAQKRANFVKAVRTAAIQQTYPQDWLGRKQKDGTYTFDLMLGGAERIHAFAPVGLMEIVRSVEEWTKEAGPGYTIKYTALTYLGPRSHPLPVISTCSSDADFFSSETVKLPYNPDNEEHQQALESGDGNLSQDRKTLFIHRRIPASEVTRENIEKAALSHLVTAAVTRILGLRKMTVEQLKAAGIDVEKIATVEYGSTRKESGKLSPAEEQRRGDIWRMLLEMAGGDEAKARAALKVRSAFGDREGVEDVARFTAKQIAFHFDKVSADFNRWKGEPPASPKGGPAGKAPPKDREEKPRETGGQRDLL